MAPAHITQLAEARNEPAAKPFTFKDLESSFTDMNGALEVLKHKDPAADDEAFCWAYYKLYDICRDLYYDYHRAYDGDVKSGRTQS